jgi:hypothetical protein
MDACDECHFNFDDVGRDDVNPRLSAVSLTISSLLISHPEGSLVRPTADRWSATEYAAHVRDVLLIMRDRLVIGLIEDDPGFKPLYRDERVALGLYAPDTPDVVAGELGSAAAMFVRLFLAIDPKLLSRPVRFGYPDPQPRTLLWMGLQAIHEAEHHLLDIRLNLNSPDGR